VRFHLPSLVLGCIVGGGAVRLAPSLRPLAVELAATGYRLADAVRAQAARRREDVEDLLAEARARANALRARVTHKGRWARADAAAPSSAPN
jgi:hypothetical protein